MADIAEIGFVADTGDLDDARIKMQALGPAASTAAKASDMLNGALDQTGSAATKAAAGISKTTSVASAAAAGMTKQSSAAMNVASANQAVASSSTAAAAGVAQVGTAANAASAGLLKMRNAANQNNISIGAMKANTANIAAQFQDIGVTAAMGMNPLQIALQQGTQLASVFAAMKPAEAVKALAAGFGSLLGVTSLLTIGLVAIVAVLLQFVNWASLAKTALNAFADILPTIAPYAVLAGAALLVAFGPAITAAVWSLTLSITAGLISALAAVIATIGAIPLAIGLILAQFYIWRDEWTKFLGFDLIKMVKDAVNGTIAGFVGAYKATIAVWGLLPGAMKDLAYQAGNALIKGIEFGVNAVLGMVTGMYNKIADLAGQAHINLTVELPKLSNPNAGDAANVLEQAKKAASAGKDYDYVGNAIKTVGTYADAAAVKVRGLADAIGLTKAKKTKSGGGKTDEEKFDDIVTGAENTIAKLTAERDAIGQTELATAQLKYQTQLLNEARQKGIELTPAGRAQLMGLADDMAKLEVQTKKVQEAFAFAKDLTKGFFSDFTQGIINGEGFWKSFGDAALNALNKIVDKILNDVIDSIFQMNAAASAGGGGFLSMLTGIFGGAFGGGGNDPGIISALGLKSGGSFNSNGMTKFAHGGDFTNSIVSKSTPFSFANGAAMGEMGEAGPEAIVPLKRMGNGDMGVSAIMPQPAANQNSGPSRPGTLNVNVVGTVGRKELAEAVQQGVEQGIDKYDTYVMPARVNEIAANPRVR